jgi:hypothetical protein
MPFIDPAPDLAASPLARVSEGVEPPRPITPSIGQTIGAAFAKDSTIFNLVRKMTDETFPAVEGYNPRLDPAVAGTDLEAFHLDKFVGSASPQETQQRIRRIEEEQQADRVLDASGAAGFVASVVASTADPTIAMPGLVAVKSVKGGYSVLRTAALTGTALAGQVAGQEAILQQTQETRTAGETVVNVATAAILGGLIGGGASSLLSRPERQAMVRALDAERADMAQHADGGPRPDNVLGMPRTGDDVFGGAPEGRQESPADGPPVRQDNAPLGPGQAAAAGASVTDTRELTPVGFGLDKIPGWSRVARFIGTDLGIFSAKSTAAKRLGSELMETTLTFEQNVERTITRPDGTTYKVAGEVTSPVVPLSREVDIHIGMAQIKIGDELKRLYSDYYFGAEDVKAPHARAQIDALLGRGEGKLSPQAFDEEIAAAMNLGDQHAVPQVAAAAAFIRKNLFDPWAARMEKANPEGFKRQEFSDGYSYFPYRYDSAKVAADRPAFVQDVATHLRTEQANKAQAKQRLEFSAAQLASWEKEIAKYERRLETLDNQQERIGVRMDERAMEIARGERRVETLEERAGEVAKDISEIEDFIRAMREDVTDPATLARLNSLEQDAKALRRADRPVTERDIERIEKEETAAVLTGVRRTAAEILTGRRGAPKVPSFASWLVSNGGIRDVGGDVAAVAGGTRVRPGLINKQGRSLDEIGEQLKNEYPGAFPDRDETGGGRPDPQQVLDWLDSSLRGRDPDWWIESLAPEVKDKIVAGQIAAGLEEALDRAGVEVKTIREASTLFRDGAFKEVTLDDLDKILADMEAVGQDIPVTMRRAAVDEQITLTREGLAETRAMIQRASRASANRQQRLREADARSEEAGFAERQNRGRLGTLQEQIEFRDLQREAVNEAIVIATRNRDEVRAKIEAEIAAWEGKSAAEAKSAIKTREKYAAKTGRDTDAPRLTGADSVVDDVVRRIIASDRDLPDAELIAKAEEITDHVLGTPIGRLPYDSHTTMNAARSPAAMQARGPINARDFNLPYDIAKKWISHDLNQVVGSWMRTMVPDTLLWERFPGEGPAMTSAYRAIQDDYARLVGEAKTAKERTRLNKEKDEMIKTLDGVVQRTRGTLNNIEGMSGRVGEGVRRVNQMTDLGMAAVTSIPDFAGPIFHHGFSTTFRDGWVPYLRGLNSEAVKLSKAELRSLGVAAEIENSTRGNAMAEIHNAYSPHTRGERLLKIASDRFFLLNLQAPETNAAKRMAGRVAMGSLLRAAKADAEGKATAKQITALRASNIDASMSRRIWEQFTTPEGGNVVDGVYISNAANWTDEQAKLHFTAALARDVERAVVTPGAEKPLWMSTNVGSLLGQYKSFTLAATNKILIANLQKSDAQSLQGLVAAVAFGVLSYRVSTLLRGQEMHDRPQDIIKEGISRSGVLGILEEANMFSAKATRGQVDIYRLIGADKPLSRNVNRTILSSILGPTAGKIENVAKATSAVANPGDWSAGDTRAVRRSIVLQNLIGLSRGFDEVENAVNSAFGIKPLQQ